MKTKNAFTPLEKAADFSRRSLPHKADGGLKPPSAQTVREPDSSLTGFTLVEVLFVVAIFLLMTLILGPFVKITKRRANIVSCAGNLYKLSLGLHKYAAEHDNAFPADLGALYPSYVKYEKAFDCPATRSIGTPDKPDYIYISGLTQRSNESDVIVYDADGNHKKRGRNVLRINGDVDWVRSTEGRPR